MSMIILGKKKSFKMTVLLLLIVTKDFDTKVMNYAFSIENKKLTFHFRRFFYYMY